MTSVQFLQTSRTRMTVYGKIRTIIGLRDGKPVFACPRCKGDFRYHEDFAPRKVIYTHGTVPSIRFAR